MLINFCLYIKIKNAPYFVTFQSFLQIKFLNLEILQNITKEYSCIHFKILN